MWTWQKLMKVWSLFFCFPILFFFFLPLNNVAFRPFHNDLHPCFWTKSRNTSWILRAWILPFPPANRSSARSAWIFVLTTSIGYLGIHKSFCDPHCVQRKSNESTFSNRTAACLLLSIVKNSSIRSTYVVNHPTIPPIPPANINLGPLISAFSGVRARLNNSYDAKYVFRKGSKVCKI